MEQNLNNDVFTQMLEEYQKLKEESIREENNVNEVKEQLLNFDVETLTQSEIDFANQITETFLTGIKEELTPEQRYQIDKLNGREKLAAAGYVWSTVNSFIVANNLRDFRNSVDIKGIVSKFLLDPLSFAAFGNVIYKAIDDFKDGVEVGEVFTFLKDGALSIISGAKFVNGMYQIIKGETIPGDNFFDRLVNYYTDIDSVNIIKSNTVNSYTLNLDTDTISLQKYMSSVQISDEIATGIDIAKPTAGGVSDLGTPGTYRTLDGVDKPLDSLDLSYEIPKTRYERVSTAISAAANYAGVIADFAVLSGNVVTLINKASSGEKILPSDITSTIGSALSVAGGAISFAGPVGQIAGLIINGIGSLVNACSSLTNLNSDSSPKDIAFAVTDLLGAFVPIVPSARAIEQALNYQKLLDGATNEIDKEIYSSLHTIASLDATPIVSWFRSIYTNIIKDDLHDELIEKYGSFEGVIRNYITNDVDFTNELKRVGDFLKRNENTEYTQYITAYLTPDQAKEIFGDDVDYRSGFDIRNYDAKLGMFHTIQYPVFTGPVFNILEEKSGIDMLPVGDAFEEKDGRKVLDTVSLGYGVGKTIPGARRIDTSTYLGYTKEALDMYIDELRKQHSIDNELQKQFGVKLEDSWMSLDYPAAGWENPRVWLDIVDDVSGKPIYNGAGDSINPIPESQYVDRVHELVHDIDNFIYTGFKRIPNINNRVRAMATDVILPNIVTGLGDDDVIYTDIIRKYTGDQSKVATRADGGEGSDILDLSHMMDDKYNNEVFDWTYSLDDNSLSLLRNKNDGLDLDLGFKNFETVILGRGVNNFKFTGGTMPVNGNIQELKISSIVGSQNNIDLSGVRSRNLVFQGSAMSNNEIVGTMNDDYIEIQDIQEEALKALNVADGIAVSMGVSSTINTQNISGGDGNDYIKCGNAGKFCSNVLNGDNGNDVLISNGQNNIINGGNGNDLIVGSSTAVNEELYGNDGNDIIEQKVDSSTELEGKYYGGNGNDTIKLTNVNSNSKIVIDGGDGIDTLDLSKIKNGVNETYIYLSGNMKINSQDSSQLTNIENLIATNSNDMIFGGSGDHVIKAGAGDDIYHGLDGNDIIYGEAGSDFIDGGNGNNIMYGGEGNDSFVLWGNSISRIMDFEKEDKIVVINDLSKIEFERHKYRDSFDSRVIDSLFLKLNDANIEIYDWYNKNLNPTDIKFEAVMQTIDQDVIAEKIRNASSGIQGEILEVLNPGTVKNGVQVGSDTYNIINGYNGYNVIKGGDGNDSLKSTDANDIIIAGAGDDEIVSYDGNKIVYLGSGSDDFLLMQEMSLNAKVMDFEKEDKIVVYEENLQCYNFERRKYTDKATNEAVDSLCIKINNSSVELYNWYNKGIQADELTIFDGNFNKNLDKNSIAEKIQNATNVSGEISGILNSGAAPAPTMVDYNDVNYAGLSSFSSNLGSVNF